MRAQSLGAMLVTLACAAAHAEVAGQGALEGTIVDAGSRLPVGGATVVVTPSDRSPLVASGRTDADGGFAFALPAGRYDVLAIYGGARWLRRGVAVGAEGATRTRGVLSVAPEEVTIHERVAGPAQPPRAIAATVKPVLPYSDTAIAENAWAIGWVLLDVDERGAVSGFRFLHRPGHDLDDIARRAVFDLRFQPAVDEAGAPVAAQVLWKLEWPSYRYSADARPAAQGASAGLEAAARPASITYASAQRFGVKPLPPCAGDGPLPAVGDGAIYRDCSPPELGRAISEPLIRQP